jgi:hypothetical protein
MLRTVEHVVLAIAAARVVKLAASDELGSVRQ